MRLAVEKVKFEKAVILAAGRGRRLKHETERLPKALVDICGHPLMELIFKNLASFTRTRSVIVATGHMADMVEERIGKECHGIRIEYVINVEYDSTNNAYTLWLLREHLSNGFLLINTDVLFDGRLLGRVELSSVRNFLVVDGTHPLDEEDMKVELLDGRIVDISKGLDPAGSHGEYIGIAGFGAEGAAELVKELDETAVGKKKTDIYYEDVIQRILERCTIRALDSAPYVWTEIDTLEDLKVARTKVYPGICEALGWR